MVAILKIDSREPEEFKSFIYDCACEIQVEPLDVGDYQFFVDEYLVMIIERKTIQDLHASISDGRHREQKMRLLSAHPKHKIVYLIEGPLQQEPHQRLRTSPGTIVSSIVNTMLRDGVHVFHTSNVRETLFFFAETLRKIGKQGVSFTQNLQDDYMSVLSGQISKNVKVKKSDNADNNCIYRAILCCIPGISTKASQIIQKEYPTLRCLIQALNENPDVLETLPGRKLPANTRLRVVDLLTSSSYCA